MKHNISIGVVLFFTLVILLLDYAGKTVFVFLTSSVLKSSMFLIYKNKEQKSFCALNIWTTDGIFMIAINPVFLTVKTTIRLKIQLKII